MYKSIIEQIEKLEKDNLTDRLEIPNLTSSERLYSEEEIIEALKKYTYIYANLMKNEIKEEELEKNIKKILGAGLSALTLIHGADNLGQNKNIDDYTFSKFKKERSQNIGQAGTQIGQAGTQIGQAGTQIGQAGMQINPKTKPAISSNSIPQPNAVQDTYSEEPKSFKQKMIDNFLNTISMNETSGGKNLKHSMVNHGIQKGSTAYGKYGLMPNTIREMANRMGKKSPLNFYNRLDDEKIASYLKKNPDHEKDFARFLAERQLDKYKGDEFKAAYSWNQGHNIPLESFSSKHKNFQDHKYVKDYIENKKYLEKNPRAIKQ
jgi:hypothetical protein